MVYVAPDFFSCAMLPLNALRAGAIGQDHSDLFYAFSMFAAGCLPGRCFKKSCIMGGLEQLDKSSARSMGSALRQDQYDCHMLSKHVVVPTSFGVFSVERSF